MQSRKIEYNPEDFIFAIKQVRIKPKEDLKKVLQEVENLSKVSVMSTIGMSSMILGTGVAWVSMWE